MIPVEPAPVVLIVEDEWLVRTDIVEEFRRAGWAVLEASSGESALGIIESGADIDALVTDIQLAARATGWDVADAFHRNRPGRPIICTSGNLAETSRLVSGSVFLHKPCPADRLIELLARAREGACVHGRTHRC